MLTAFPLYSLLVLNTTLRLFTNGLNWAPRVFNLIDLMVICLLGLTVLASTHLCRLGCTSKAIYRRLLAFAGILVIGTMLNHQYIFPVPALSQVLMLLAPVCAFLLFMKLPLSLKNIATFNRLLFVLIILEVSIGFLQVPIYFITGNSEAIIGTFQGNAEQYACFMLVAMFFVLGKMYTKPQKKRGYALLFTGILVMTLLIDNKASWFGLAVSILYVFHKVSGSWERLSRKIEYIGAVCLIFSVGLLTVTTQSRSIHKFGRLKQAWDGGHFQDLAIVKAYRDILSSFVNHPHMFLFGSGPATFYSRASRSFYEISDAEMYSQSAALPRTDNVHYRASNSMGGVVERLQADAYFLQFYKHRKIYSIGSGQVDNPFSSYTGVLGETGILGVIAYFSIYYVALRQLLMCFKRHWRDPNIFPLVLASIAFLVYLCAISVYNNWIETTRMTTILWSMIAVTFKYNALAKKRVPVVAKT